MNIVMKLKLALICVSFVKLKLAAHALPTNSKGNTRNLVKVVENFLTPEECDHILLRLQVQHNQKNEKEMNKKNKEKNHKKNKNIAPEDTITRCLPPSQYIDGEGAAAPVHDSHLDNFHCAQLVDLIDVKLRLEISLQVELALSGVHESYSTPLVVTMITNTTQPHFGVWYYSASAGDILEQLLLSDDSKIGFVFLEEVEGVYFSYTASPGKKEDVSSNNEIVPMKKGTLVTYNHNVLHHMVLPLLLGEQDGSNTTSSSFSGSRPVHILGPFVQISIGFDQLMMRHLDLTLQNTTTSMPSSMPSTRPSIMPSSSPSSRKKGGGGMMGNGREGMMIGKKTKK